jgi:hypothetical protein
VKYEAARRRTLDWMEEDAAYVGLGSASMDDLVTLRNAIIRWQQAAGEVRKAIDAEVAHRIGEGGALRVGESILRYRPRRTPKLVDPQALIDWLGPDWRAVIPVTASTRVRLAALDTVAEKRGADAVTVRDTFIEWAEGPPGLDEMPVDKAPRWAMSMRDGDVRPGRALEPGDDERMGGEDG